ncbi:MAG: nucleotide sugar dehydrogenase [Gammaproteobacteria bacterium]|nr:nucleotide sugar dehydrogenase [Gammaproteobacteria bacterium]
MPLSFTDETEFNWQLRKICVIGPGIVGMPMAALIAAAEIKEGSDEPAKVVVVQRDSKTSGWKVPAINAGKSVIGGVEPALDAIVAKSVADGVLSASHDYSTTADADMVLVCVQTDKKGFGPDYGPMFECLKNLASALQSKPEGNIPVIAFESTLAPSSMTTLIREHFAEYGLIEGQDILLGNSPNRVMPGRLVERVAESDKLVAGLHPLTPKLIQRVYKHIVTRGTLHPTNSMTAEVVKTLENAYRDVRIAYAAELVRYCDKSDIDFFALRDAVNARFGQEDAASGSATAVPSGAVLVPTVGVGGHCLPKDGILLWWRRIESGFDTSNSLIVQSRVINDESPAHAISLAEKAFGSLKGRKVALLGTAYRFDSEDTRNSPTLDLARQLLDLGADITIHDPYVKRDDQNLERRELTDYFTNELGDALADADIAIICTGHGVYASGLDDILSAAPKLEGLVDGANVYGASAFEDKAVGYTGIGRGTQSPPEALIDFATESFRAVEHGVANELSALIDFLNERYASSDFNQVSLDRVRELAGSCVTGCVIAETKADLTVPEYEGFSSRLATFAVNQLNA